ncbi:uncharacterized protein LOC133300957 [Gastrolobium bilobum]|uniref:uncharacterized protein LOC133300957 n=1 Tax=Gastrolobium bilobum TaxID=150636 RepID=UPI002AB1A6B8|nr:uncharacterized protein LOC133300957 [Gastrolobium bilobum]
MVGEHNILLSASRPNHDKKWVKYCMKLHDHQLIRDCGFSSDHKIEAAVQSFAGAGGSSSGRGSGKLEIILRITRTDEKITVEVNAGDIVEKLRDKVEMLREPDGLRLPDRYLFIHTHKVIRADRPFQWHHVKHGDTIEIHVILMDPATAPQKRRNYH